MKKVIVLISFLCGAFFVSAQQGNQQQRQQERWKPESTEWYHPVPPKVTPGVGTSPNPPPVKAAKFSDR